MKTPNIDTNRPQLIDFLVQNDNNICSGSEKGMVCQFGRVVKALDSNGEIKFSLGSQVRIL